jgi:hypothetical protein
LEQILWAESDGVAPYSYEKNHPDINRWPTLVSYTLHTLRKPILAYPRKQKQLPLQEAVYGFFSEYEYTIDIRCLYLTKSQVSVKTTEKIGGGLGKNHAL